MAKKQLTEEQLKEIKILQASNEMLERTKREVQERGGDTLPQIQEAQNEVLAHMRTISESAMEEAVEQNLKNQKTISNDGIQIDNMINQDKQSIYDILDEGNLSPKPTIQKEEPLFDASQDSDVQYDVIALPSKGEGYPMKMERIPVGFLTAYDENFITSPNLYRDGLVIDFLLKNKVLNKNIDVDDLYKGDADAIILFLRATSYGSDFPIKVKDPESGEIIETTFDLNELKVKEFNLKADSEGNFSFTLPLSKKVVKFKFLTRKQEKQLDRVLKMENKGAMLTTLKRNAAEIKAALENDDILTNTERNEIGGYLNSLEKWAKTLESKNMVGYNKFVTNRLEMCITEADGHKDRQYIHNFVNNMRAKDALELRKYISDNEPGIDFKINVQRPANLGGGSFATFLEWGDSVFLNIT